MIACFCPVSTVDQSLDRQFTTTTDYTRDRFVVELPEIKISGRTVRFVE